MELQDVLPNGFIPTAPSNTTVFAFEVLGPEHNESDLAAWASSIAEISAVPGFQDGWPTRAYNLAENLADLTEHADHHAAGIDYAWTILAPGTDEVIGCLYVKPGPVGPIAKWWLRRDRRSETSSLDAHIVGWLATWPVRVDPVSVSGS